MADMSASGWYPSNVQVIRSWKQWGVGNLRQSLVQLTMEATQFGGGAQLVPLEGIPAPLPSTVGLRQAIEYIIPVSPFYHTTQAAGRFLTWGCVPPTYGASGGTVSTGCRIKIMDPQVRISGSASAANGITSVLFTQGVSGRAASDVFTTDTMRAYGIFVGR